MINVSFPDGSKREYPDGSTPFSIAESISKSLAKRSVIAKVNGEVRDMKRPLDGDASLELLDINSRDGLELLRHDAAHVLAQAVQELFPGTQVTIGPVIEDGFYYDFARKEPFSTEDFAKIEARMK
jgi:threonyl-tRNA synthetase